MHEEPTDAQREAYLDDVRKTIDEFGVMLQGVFPTGEGGSLFIYTVGLTAHNHPELLIAGMSFEQGGAVLNGFAADIIAGKKRLADPGPSDDLFVGLLAYLIPVTHNVIGTAKAVYGEEAAALQVVWPDKEGRFPWDRDFYDGQTDYKTGKYEELFGPAPV